MALTEEEQDDWFDALQSGDVDTLKNLYDKGADVNAPLGDQPGIMVAAIVDKIESVQFLVEHGANIDAIDGWHKITALTLVASGENYEMVKFLLDRGANVNGAEGADWTPYDFARQNTRDRKNYKEIVTLLWNRKGKPKHPKTVLVTGAGFTKAFYSKAPLLVDDFQIKSEILPKYKDFPTAVAILETELAQQKEIDGNENGRINLERLMTRLAGGMPYDGFLSKDENQILAVLLEDLKNRLVDRIKDADQNGEHNSGLSDLARYCLVSNINIITFNYDDFLDRKLEECCGYGEWRENLDSWELYQNAWHLNNGYGFYCCPSHELLGIKADTGQFPQNTKIRLLKMHGALNWRLRLGAITPYKTADLVHHETWSRSNLLDSRTPEFLSNKHLVDLHLESSPFIIPPVLSKAAYMSQPILSVLWKQAYDLLRSADHIIFVGYSLPSTDLATLTLLREATLDLYPSIPKVQVVNYSEDDEQKEAIKRAYRQVFPRLPDEAFIFDGAVAWAERFVTQNGADLLQEVAG